MKKTYRIKGLCCANCALELEREISKITAVNLVSINFLSETMELDCNDDAFKVVEKACNEFEDGVTLKRIK